MKKIDLFVAPLWLLLANPASAQVVWVQASTPGPSARFGHAMTFDESRGEVFLFGGSTNSDSWGWNGSTWTLRAQQGPSPRSEHSMVFDAARGRVVLFGGMTTTGETGDTWEWDGANWIPMLFASGPAPRSMHAMAYASSIQRTVLHGGRSNSIDLNDTWLWNGASWASASGAAPPSRSDHAMYFDPQTQRTVIAGGKRRTTQSGSYWFILSWTYIPWSVTWEQALDDCWAFDGTNWSATTNLREPRFGATAAFDPSRQIAILHGGMDNRSVFTPGIPGIPAQQAGSPGSVTENPETLGSTDAAWSPTSNWVRLGNQVPQVRSHASEPEKISPFSRRLRDVPALMFHGQHDVVR